METTNFDQQQPVCVISSERLAHWFLRLNGFLTIPNFIVHPEADAYGQGTDVDVLGVRFPNRAENRLRPMEDFRLFVGTAKIQIVISEVKTKQCKLNGPWTEPARENIHKILFAGGFFEAEHVEKVARELYAKGRWQDDRFDVRIVCFGDKHNSGIRRDYPEVPQLLWHRDILPFIRQRFFTYRLEKRLHEQWDPDVKLLWKTCFDSTDEEQFIRNIEITSPDYSA